VNFAPGKIPSGGKSPRKCIYNDPAPQVMAKHRAKCSWPPVSDVAVTKARRETRWKLLGCRKLQDRSQSLAGRSSPYCKDMWRRYCCLTRFFPIADTCLNCENIARQSCAMEPRWRIFDDFCIMYFQRAPCSTFQTRAFEIRTKAASCVEVWQTSNA